MATRAATGRLTSETGSDREAEWLAAMEARFAARADRFNSLDLARETHRTHVVCLGDSHLFVFRDDLPQRNVAKLLPHWFDPCIVVGATARGLRNPFSRTNALNIFRRRIELAASWQPLVFQLGEVDCGFLIWFRSEQEGDSIDAELERSVEGYLAFLTAVRASGFEQLFVLSAPLPTVEHDHEWVGPTHARRSIAVPQRDRTELTVRFNEEMAHHAGDYEFLDVSSATRDDATGLIKAEFVSEDATDHHLAAEPYSRVIAERLGAHLRAP
jgi:hypothetical protein